MARGMTLQQIGTKAETLGIYNVASERRGILYCYNDGEYAIITPKKGTIRLSAAEVEIVLTELAGIKDDIDHLKRGGFRR